MKSFIKKYSTVLKVIVSLLFFAYFLTRVNLSELSANLQHVPVIILVLAVAINVFSILVNSFKWQIFLDNISIYKLFELNMISQFYNIILPGQFGGDFAKMYRTYREDSGAKNKALSSIIIDRFISLFSILLLLDFGIFFSKLQAVRQLSPYFLTATALSLACIGFLGLGAVNKFFKINILKLKIKESIKVKFADTLGYFHGSFKRIDKLIIALIIGVIFQLLSILVMMLFDRYLNINIHFFDYLWISTILSFAIFLPISIGGVGVREATLVSLLGLIGVNSEKAFTLSILLFLVQLSGGFIGYFFELKYLNKRKRQKVPCKG